jgi:hypothetical protein
MNNSKSGAELISEERQRQINEEGWTAAHDDEHVGFELSQAAQYYAECAHDAFYRVSEVHIHRRNDTYWPAGWDECYAKPSTDPIRNLVKAGALIAAEIDRLQRSESHGS